MRSNTRHGPNGQLGLRAKWLLVLELLLRFPFAWPCQPQPEQAYNGFCEQERHGA